MGEKLKLNLKKEKKKKTIKFAETSRGHELEKGITQA